MDQNASDEIEVPVEIIPLWGDFFVAYRRWRFDQLGYFISRSEVYWCRIPGQFGLWQADRACSCTGDAGGEV